jgi:hypothetical protein
MNPIRCSGPPTDSLTNENVHVLISTIEFCGRKIGFFSFSSFPKEKYVFLATEVDSHAEIRIVRRIEHPVI